MDLLAHGEQSADRSDELWQRLIKLDTVREQQTAFTCATGLPLTLLPASESVSMAVTPKGARIFCVQGCMGGQSGELCQRLLQRAERRATDGKEPVQYRCPTGLTKIVVPVFAQGHHIGNVLVGPFSLSKLSATVFQRLKRKLTRTGLNLQADRLRVSWRYSPVVSSQKGRAVAMMVSLVAQYLTECGDRLLSAETDMRSPLLKQVETVLAENRDHSISVRELAVRVSLSPCHFCKVFKKQTGLTFTEYRTRLRVKKARQLLLNPYLRVSEVAFEAGFDSIQYFNRAFRRLEGCSPTQYRARSGTENG